MHIMLNLKNISFILQSFQNISAEVLFRSIHLFYIFEGPVLKKWETQ